MRRVCLTVLVATLCWVFGSMATTSAAMVASPETSPLTAYSYDSAPTAESAAMADYDRGPPSRTHRLHYPSADGSGSIAFSVLPDGPTAAPTYDYDALGALAQTDDNAAEGAGALEQGAARVPSAWGDGVANSKGVGTRWFDPAAPKANGIRIDEGIPGSSWPSQQVDHVVVRSGGRILGPDGKPIVGTLGDNPQAHIPLSDWLWTSWNAP